MTLYYNAQYKWIYKFSKFSAPTIAFLAFWLAKKNSDYEPIVGVLRHIENNAPSLKNFLSGYFVKLWK